MRLVTLKLLLPLLTMAAAAACESKPKPCAGYERMARANKGGALVQYCLNRQGRPVGPFLCELEDGSGGVTGQYEAGRRHGTWTYTGPEKVLIRKEQWQNDERVDLKEYNPDLPPLPEGVAAAHCDGNILWWADESAGDKAAPLSDSTDDSAAQLER